MNQIDFFEGLKTSQTNLDPSKVPKKDELRKLRHELVDQIDELGAVDLEDEERAELGVTHSPEQAALASACLSFVEERPEVASLCGDPVDHWKTVQALGHAYKETVDATGPLCERAQVNELVLRKELTSKVELLRSHVAAELSSPNTTDQRRGVLLIYKEALDAPAKDRLASAEARKKASAARRDRDEETVGRLVQNERMLRKLAELKDGKASAMVANPAKKQKRRES